MHYRSVFLETDGSRASAVLEARDEQELHETLHAEGKLLLLAKPDAPRAVASRRLPARNLMLFAQSMESSMAAGVPVLMALEAIREQEPDPRLRRVFDSIIERVSGGEGLADALEAFPRSFSPIFCALVRAGESSGSLPRAFERLGSFLEWREELRATVRQAAAYPAIVVCAAYGLILFLLAFVLPRLSDVIAKLGVDNLPFASRLLIEISQLVAGNVFAVVGATAALLALLGAALRTDVGRVLATGMLVRLPVVRAVVRTLNLAQLCRTMSVLLEAGLTVIQAMRLCIPTLSLADLRESLQDATDRLLSGSKITESFAEAELLPPVALSMVRIGEHSGDMPRSFERLGGMYDREAKSAVKRALGMLEPVVTVVLGIVIGGVAALVISTLYTAVGGLAK